MHFTDIFATSNSTDSDDKHINNKKNLSASSSIGLALPLQNYLMKKNSGSPFRNNKNKNDDKDAVKQGKVIDKKYLSRSSSSSSISNSSNHSSVTAKTSNRSNIIRDTNNNSNSSCTGTARIQRTKQVIDEIQQLNKERNKVKEELKHLRQKTLFDQLQNECEIETLSGRMKLKQLKTDNNLNSSVIKQKMASRFPLSLYIEYIRNNNNNNNNNEVNDDENSSTSAQLIFKESKQQQDEKKQILQLQGQLCRSYHHVGIICKQISIHERNSFTCGEEYLSSIKTKMKEEFQDIETIHEKQIHLMNDEICYLKTNYTSLLDKTLLINNKHKTYQEQEVLNIIEEQENLLFTN